MLSKKLMKCPNCDRNALTIVEEVSGSFVTDILENGEYDKTNKEFYGDAWSFIECSSCEARFSYTFNGNKIVIEGEE